MPCLVKQLSGGANRARHCREAAEAGPAWGDRNGGHKTCRDYGKKVHADG